MKLHRFFTLIIFLFLVFPFLFSDVSAQSLPGYDFEYDVPGCDGNQHHIRWYNWSSNPPFVSFTISIDGNSRSFTLNNDLAEDYTIDDQGRFVHNDSEWQAYYNFWMSELGCSFSFSGGDFGGGSNITANPVVAQNVQSFTKVVFSERARPKAAGKKVKKTAKKEEDESEKKAELRRTTDTNSDLEYESFEIGSSSGSNLAIRGGIAKMSDNGRWIYGGNFIYNSLSFDGADNSFNNNTINAFVNNVFDESDTQESYWGATFNYLLIDGDMSDDNGLAFGVHGVKKLYGEESITVFGVMAQYAKIGDLTTWFANAAFLYGFPIGETMSLNIDALYLYNINASYDGNEIEIEHPSTLIPGITLDLYMSETFGLNFGVKTVLLQEDYTSWIFTIGAGWRF
ncbi:hypothetical protein ACFLSX_05480 [Calditrichota bacterium]